MGGHGAEHQGASVAELDHQEGERGHGDPHEHGSDHAGTSAEDAEAPGHDGSHGADDPASGACLSLCAVACSVGQTSPPDVTRRAPDLLSGARLAQAPVPEPMELVPAVARPHVLPFSQAPPTKT